MSNAVQCPKISSNNVNTSSYFHSYRSSFQRNTSEWLVSITITGTVLYEYGYCIVIQLYLAHRYSALLGTTQLATVAQYTDVTYKHATEQIELTSMESMSGKLDFLLARYSSYLCVGLWTLHARVDF